MSYKLPSRWNHKNPTRKPNLGIFKKPKTVHTSIVDLYTIEKFEIQTASRKNHNKTNFSYIGTTRQDF